MFFRLDLFMPNRKIRLFIALSVISLLGIAITQAYWFRTAFNQQNREFHRDVNMALNEIVVVLAGQGTSTLPVSNPIRQLSGNYYVVMINGPIDSHLLTRLLQEKLDRYRIDVGYEYAIYDCTTNCMVYGSANEVLIADPDIPRWDMSDYYFGVYFPDRTNYLVGKMGIWIFSSIVLLIVIFFFGYSMMVILKQKRLSEIQKDFIDNITHEFKTPLTTLEVAANVLSNPETHADQERIHRYSMIVREETARLHNQVENLLQLKSLENRKAIITRKPVNINELVREVEKFMINSLRACTIKVHFEAIEADVLADHDHIFNSLCALIDNACKYCREFPQIILNTRNTQNEIMISITDNGIGIGQSEQARDL